MIKFLCDEMLGGLGRWLRTAGYDTVIIDASQPDGEILKRALQEGRILLSRDRHFLNMDAPDGALIYLNHNSLEECVRELTRRLNLDWLYDPFSRCIDCNIILVKPDDETVSDQVPPHVREESKNFFYCPHCKKVFWEGSHTERMMEQLQIWQKS